MSMATVAFVISLVLGIAATGMSFYILRRLVLLESKINMPSSACVSNKKRRIEEEECLFSDAEAEAEEEEEEEEEDSLAEDMSRPSNPLRED